MDALRRAEAHEATAEPDSVSVNRSRSNCEIDSYSQRNIPMLLRRILIPLRLQHLQRLNQLPARFSRLNHRIHKSAIGGHVGVGKGVAEFFDLLLPHGLAIFSAIQLALVDNV